jgi:colanic acid/amylovoran biosynthesis glycosyltransferase
VNVAYILGAKRGIPAWNYREIDVLSRHGVQVWIYALKWRDGPYVPKPEWHFTPPSWAQAVCRQPLVFARWPGRYLQLLGRALRTRTLPEFLFAGDFALGMRRAGIQHIHCHFGDRKLFAGYYCSLLLDLPLTVTVHAYEILANPNPEMFRLAARQCARVITISEFNKAELVRLYGLDPQHIEVVRIHGDVADERVRNSVKLFVAAEFTEKKGYEVLLQALQQLGRSDITLWVAGAGHIDVPALARQYGVDGQTVFVGSVGEPLMNILYEACDIFVLASRTTASGDREGIPVVLMEAMSHHKPVISTRHTGIPELVPEILVDEGDVAGLAAAIVRLADDPELCARLGERNAAIVRAEYSEAAVLRLLDIFGKR